MSDLAECPKCNRLVLWPCEDCDPTDWEYEYRNLKSAFEDRCKVIQLQLEDKEKLKAENAVMREALEFIADPSITDHPFKNDMKALEHVGDVARCALAEIKGEG